MSQADPTVPSDVLPAINIGDLRFISATVRAISMYEHAWQLFARGVGSRRSIIQI